MSISPATTGSGDRPPLPRGAILNPPKPYNDVAETTFGPLEKYVAANDNRPAESAAARHVAKELKPLRDAIMSNTGKWQFSSPQVPVSPPARIGDWMQTYTSRKFWPLDPRSDEVFIEDIAHSLSMQCRYAGHCRRFYSVAEHSVHIARWLLPTHGKEIALWGLMHDASEAYLVDVPRPVKPYLAGYKEAEAKVMAAVCERFSLPKEMPAIVHEADNCIIGDELVNLLPMAWHERYNEPLGVGLKCWYPEQAEDEFLATFEALTGSEG